MDIALIRLENGQMQVSCRTVLESFERQLRLFLNGKLICKRSLGEDAGRPMKL